MIYFKRSTHTHCIKQKTGKVLCQSYKWIFLAEKSMKLISKTLQIVVWASFLEGKDWVCNRQLSLATLSLEIDKYCQKSPLLKFLDSLIIGSVLRSYQLQFCVNKLRHFFSKNVPFWISWLKMPLITVKCRTSLSLSKTLIASSKHIYVGSILTFV